MKKTRLAVICAAISVIAVFCGTAVIHYSADDQLTNEDFIRLHVVASSDSQEDQALKLKVRDRVIEYVDDSLVREAVRKADMDEDGIEFGIEDSRAFIIDNLDEIAEVAQDVIAEEGFDVPVSAEYGVSWIPRKAYGDVVFPAGNYEALKILIGEARGQNWWCVLYPPLCLIDTGEYEENEILRDAVMQGKYSQLAAEKQGTEKILKVRFKTLEIIKRISD